MHANESININKYQLIHISQRTNNYITYKNIKNTTY